MPSDFSSCPVSAALYIRLSHKEKLQGRSIEAQRSALEQYAHKHHYTIFSEYIDDGFTARRRNYTSRPDLMRLIHDISLGHIQLILVMKLDRFSRNICDFYELQKIFDQYQVTWKSISEEFDTTTANGRLYLNISLAFAQHEADRTGDRIKDVNRYKIAHGQVTTGHTSLGYQIQHSRLVIDEKKAPIIRDLFQHFQSSCCQSETRKYIEKKYGLYLSESRLHQMLKRKIYKGELRGNSSYCEPIISPSQFDQVQELLKKNVRKTPTGQTYLFSGCITCSQCCQKMAVKSPDHLRPHLLYYRCPGYWKKHACPNNHFVNETFLEQYLIKRMDVLLDGILLCLNMSLVKTEDSFSASPLEKKLERLKELYIHHFIDLETYKKDFSRLHHQETNQISCPPLPGCHKKWLWNDLYASFTDQEKQLFWRLCIQQIYFDGQVIFIRFCGTDM